jgi:hypothetical protein
MSILFKRKLIATLILFISLFDAISIQFFIYEIHKVIFVGIFSVISLIILTYFASSNSNTITHWFRRKKLDEREREDHKENVRQIMVFNAGYIFVLFFGVFGLGNFGFNFFPAFRYEYGFFNPFLMVFPIFLFLLFCSSIAIPLWRDKYVEDDTDLQTFSKNYRWFLRIFAGLILGSIFAGFAGFYYFTMTTEKTINGIEGTNGLETIGRFDLIVDIKPGKPTVEIKGPRYLVDRFEIKTDSNTNQTAFYAFNETPKDINTIYLISTSREATVTTFGKLKVYMTIPSIEYLSVAYGTNMTIQGGCLTGKKVYLITQNEFPIQNLCITTAGDVKMKYTAQPSAYWNFDADATKYIKVPSVFGYANKISILNMWNEGIDITNMTGKELVLPTKDSNYFDQGEKIKYNRNSFESVRNAMMNGEEVK